MHRLITLALIVVIGFANSWEPARAQGDLFNRINTLRQSLGLAAYTSNGALVAAAQNHAQWMIANPGVVSHVQSDGSRPRDRAANAGYNSPWVSENIYLGGPTSSLEDAWSFWMNSTIHYQQITNARYQHIGIATQSDGFYTAYVLVFGAPEFVAAGTSGGSNASNNGSANDSPDAAEAVPAAPSFIVGVDNAGNIMHEVQEGDTLGDIALLYGYSWEDIPTMLALNDLTENDIRVMQVGSVFLIPPQSGTYTPTPPLEPTLPPSESTAEASVPDDDSATTDDASEPTRVNPSSLGILPTPQPASDLNPANESVALPSPESTDSMLPPPVVFAVTSTPAPTMTATNTPPATATLVSTQVALVVSVTVTPLLDMSTSDELPAQQANGLPAWLIAGIIAQIGVLAAAIAEYVRRLFKANSIK